MTTAIATQTSSRIQNARFAGGTAATKSPRPSYLRPLPTPAPESRGTLSLERIGSLQVVARGATIVDQGDPAEHVFKIVSGALRVVRLLPDGRRSVINFLLPGDFFGLAENGTYTHSLEVLADASFVRYPKAQLRDVLDNDPTAGRRFFNLMCEQLSAAQERQLTLCRKNAIERIASFLLAMTDRSKTQGKSAGTTVRLPMNRADIADYLGLTIETVSRVLTQLREQQIIEVPTASQIVLRDCERLAAISDGEI
jgi:CRP/FNR family transcriptional regulator